MRKMETGQPTGFLDHSVFFPRSHWYSGWLLVLLCGGLLIAGNTPLQAFEIGTLYPENTAMLISVDNAVLMRDHWKQTDFSKLAADPTMEQFATNLRKQMEERWGRLGAFAGIGWDDFLNVSGGGVAMGTVPSTTGTPTEVILINISGKAEESKELLGRISANVQNQSGRVSTLKIYDRLPATCYELPPPKNWRRANPPILYSAFYGDWLLVSDEANSIYDVCLRIGQVKKESLAGRENYQKTMAMLDGDMKVDGHIRFFIDPPLLSLFPEDETVPRGEMTPRKSTKQLFAEQGLNGMLGIAGKIDLATAGCEGQLKLAVYAPKPREKSFAMLELMDAEVLPIDTWVPKDAADCMTIRLDIDNAFDHFGPIFDEAAGQEGAWEEALEGLQKDPYGEQIDVHKELIACLGDRVTIAAKYRTPVSTTSQRYIIAIDVKDEAALKQGLDKFYRYSPEMQENRKLGEIMIRERDPSKQAAPDSLERPGFGHSRGEARNPSRTEPTGEEREIFPNRAVAVTNGKLWIASHLDILHEVLSAQPTSGFGSTVEAKLVDQKFQELGSKRRGMRMTLKLDESIRNDYELMRMRQFEQSQSLAGRLFASILPELENPDMLRFDLSSAPEFGYLRRSLGPAGLEIETAENGWIIRGILLPK